MRLLPLFSALVGLLGSLASVNIGKRDSVCAGLSDTVSWDEYSLSINGTRLAIFSGEFHPFRLPVPSLWLDVLQKIKSMGFNTVSIYVMWALIEPKKGEVSFEGYRDLQPFFDAAMEAGLYVIARPGPYINAETTAGGFPGWGTYTPGLWRTSNDTIVEAWQDYVRGVGNLIAKNQIDNGGPVILVQAENEYSGFQAPYTEDFVYQEKLLQDFCDAGITVPITANDVYPGGRLKMVDIYGYDNYPNGFDCTNPYDWKASAVPDQLWGDRIKINPEDLNAIFEYQGGAFDGWGGSGFEKCSLLTGPEFERVFYKSNFAMSTTLLSIYMIFGGTNHGGISHPGGYTSYDYGAAIAEDRTLREKYYELKLQANFWAVSPAYWTSRPVNYNSTLGAFTNDDAMKVSQVADSQSNTTFYVIRAADQSSNEAHTNTLSVTSSIGDITIPFLGEITTKAKDSKIIPVDYIAGSTHLLYSTAEIMTWATVDGRDIVIVYGNIGDICETAIKYEGETVPEAQVVDGDGLITSEAHGDHTLILQYHTDAQTVVEVGNTTFYLLDRQTAYDFWVVHLPGQDAYSHFARDEVVIVKGGYLVRSATLDGDVLSLHGDLNSTTPFEIITPAVASGKVTFNGQELAVERTSYGTLKTTSSLEANLPEISLPDLQSLTWRSANSLPEISPEYSDADWTVANRTSTVNPNQYNTSVVLIAGDYGYHTGNIIYRAHFTSSGEETGFYTNIWGGLAFAFSVWLDDTLVGSWEGDAITNDYNTTFDFPSTLDAGSEHVLTILQDHMGYEGDWTVASDWFKRPRGILDFYFTGSGNTTVDTWKLTGNLGGEDYIDRERGPLNEGGLYAERQGWHLPGFDDSPWTDASPLDGVTEAGVQFYRTTFGLSIPEGVDYPISLVTSNATDLPHFRSQFYVNGYQFGKYINHVGPQTAFPVPQGILDYQGQNTLAVSIWAAEDGGAELNTLELQFTAQLESAVPAVVNQPLTPWAERPGAY